MKQQTFDNFDRLLEPKKLISIGILCLIAFLVIFFLWRKLKGTLKDSAAKLNEDIEIQKLQASKKQEPTYSDYEYSVWADQLYAAMDGMGTTEKTVVTIFGYMQNDVDVHKLIKAFGNRRGTYCLSSENLYEWIANDHVSDEVNNVLASKGITVRF